MLRLLFSVCLVGCGAAPDLTSGSEVVLSLSELDCLSCGDGAVEMLQDRPEVHAARFDRERVELSVRYDPARTNPDTLAVLVRDRFECKVTIGGGAGGFKAAPAYPEGADVKVINEIGRAVDIAPHLAPGKVTVVDFFAEWCGPCKEVDRTLVDLIGAGTDIAVRKLNVGDWDSEVAKRYLSGIRELPYVLVYDPKGERVAEITGLDLVALRAAIKEGAQ